MTTTTKPTLSSATTAKELMHADVVSVHKDAHLEHTLRLMQQHRVSKVPVVDGERVVGIVTDGSIAEKLGALHNKNVHTNTLHASSVMVRDFGEAAPTDPWERVLTLLDGDEVGLVCIVDDDVLMGVVTKADFLGFVDDPRPVTELAPSALVSVAPTDRVVHARRLMLEHGIERVPVLDAGEVQGIVSELDIACALEMMKKRVEQSHQARHLDQLTVADVMARPVITCTPETSASEAARLMADEDVGCLPIVNGTGQVRGLVTRSDLVRGLVDPTPPTP